MGVGNLQHLCMKCSESLNKVLKGIRGQRTSGFAEMLRESGLGPGGWGLGSARQVEAMPRAESTGTASHFAVEKAGE